MSPRPVMKESCQNMWKSVQDEANAEWDIKNRKPETEKQTVAVKWLDSKEMRVHSQDDENISVYKLLGVFLFRDDDADTGGETKLDQASISSSISSPKSPSSFSSSLTEVLRYLLHSGVFSALQRERNPPTHTHTHTRRSEITYSTQWSAGSH